MNAANRPPLDDLCLVYSTVCFPDYQIGSNFLHHISNTQLGRLQINKKMLVRQTGYTQFIKCRCLKQHEMFYICICQKSEERLLHIYMNVLFGFPSFL